MKALLAGRETILTFASRTNRTARPEPILKVLTRGVFIREEFEELEGADCGSRHLTVSPVVFLKAFVAQTATPLSFVSAVHTQASRDKCLLLFARDRVVSFQAIRAKRLAALRFYHPHLSTTLTVAR
jgi:hypothetical protein